MLRSELHDRDDQELRRCRRRESRMHAGHASGSGKPESLRSLAKFGELVDDSAVF